MTNNSPNSSEQESNKLLPEYEYSARHEGDSISKSLRAKNLNGYLSNGEISFFENNSREGSSCDKIRKVTEQVTDETILVRDISITSEHHINISIEIDGIEFKGELQTKVIPAKKKKQSPITRYEIEFESEKVMIGSQMLIGNKVIEITEANINDYNKRKLSFTGLITDDNQEVDYFEISDGEITDYKNTPVNIINKGKKLPSFIGGVVTSAMIILGVQNYSSESKEFAIDLSNEVSYQVSEVSNSVLDSINGIMLEPHEVKSGENLTKILKSKNISFTSTQLDNKVLSLGSLLNITVDENNHLIEVEDAFSGVKYTK